MTASRLARMCAVTLAATLALVACGDDDDSSSDTTAASGCPEPKDNEVVICQFAFAPAELTVAAGTEVTWTNADDFGHTATGEAFDSTPLDGGTSFSHTFDTPGTFPYVCNIHNTMTGTVVVT